MLFCISKKEFMCKYAHSHSLPRIHDMGNGLTSGMTSQYDFQGMAFYDVLILCHVHYLLFKKLTE